ncbi:hypothetical protein SAMN02910456_01287 [Ruminococcaceae bacterium YRB3002]|nr:hypothetical protein SAMN02910456_01287 [Ruminococcaceae bacterium YRB3002]
MKIESMNCPNCGRSLNLSEEDQNKEFVTCPACGTQLHIDYENKGGGTGTGRDPRTTIMNEANGTPIAHVIVPEGWTAKGMIMPIDQGIDKPFQATVLARSNDGASTIFIRSGEMFIDVLQQFDHLTGGDAFAQGKMLKTYPMKMYRQMPVSQYMDAVAGGMFKGFQITPVADAKLPSFWGTHPDMAQKHLNYKFEFQHFWDMCFTNPVCEMFLLSSKTGSFLRKYTSQANVHLLGLDMSFLETEMRSTGLELAYGMAGLMAMSVNKGSGHYMHWGSEIIFSCTTDAAHEAAATAAFMQMVSSFTFDEAIYKAKFQKAEMFNRQQLAIQAQANQINAQLQQQLAANQARLQQTLADNSRAMSDMIMDSWDKKMASDSRVSQARHEATMGVNTYLRTDGTTVEHSVVADHVYENSYGDTVGVSGSAIDPSLIPDWREIPKA